MDKQFTCPECGSHNFSSHAVEDGERQYTCSGHNAHTVMVRKCGRVYSRLEFEMNHKPTVEAELETVISALILIECTVPKVENKVRTDSSEASLGKLPTNNFFISLSYRAAMHSLWERGTTPSRTVGRGRLCSSNKAVD